MSYIIYNIKKKMLEIVDKNAIMDGFYYLEYRPITNDDINLKNSSMKMKMINKYIKKDNNIVQTMRTLISKIDNKIPLFDMFSNNIFLILPQDIYERVVNQSFRFPDQKVLDELKPSTKRSLMLQFMSYFDLEILYQTYVKLLNNNSNASNELTTYVKPSFLPQFYHLRPYYTKNEIINLALNMNLQSINSKLCDIEKLYSLVSKNEMDSEMLLTHKKYMLNEQSVGMLQFYTLQGSHMMNQYLRNLTTYKYKNDYLETLISPVWNLILSTPGFNKKYILYRFIQEDSFLSHLNIGDTYIENGFLSTTRDPFYTPVSHNFGYILIKINIPEQVKGVALCIETVSHFPEEQEVIFAPLSKFKLIKKDYDCVYYHTNNTYSSKIKTRYEFDWVGNSSVKFSRQANPNLSIKTVDFLKLKRNSELTFDENKLEFNNNYINEMDQFKMIIDNKEFIIIREYYDSTGSYKPYYGMTTKKGFALFTVYNNYLLFFIEFDNDLDPHIPRHHLHINFFMKYNKIDPNQVIGDKNLLLVYTSIAYFMNANIIMYPNYMNCNDNTQTFAGTYCLDYYQYLTTNKKKYENEMVMYNEFIPQFSYYDLDILKTISPIRILDRTNGEVYQVYKDTYLNNHNHNDNIIDFYIWLIHYKGYLLNKYLILINKILSKNPFIHNDVYYIRARTYLVNRKYITLE